MRRAPGTATTAGYGGDTDRLELAATVLVELDVDRFDLVVAEAGDGPFNPPPGMGGYELVGRRPVGVGFASGWAVLTYQAQP